MNQEHNEPLPVDAVVLAGSINQIPLYPGNEPGRKALVKLRGRPLIAYVLEALHASPRVGRIFVVGPPEVLDYAARWPEVTGVPEGRTLVDNAWKGLQAAGTDWVFFCNPDQPLLREVMVTDFIDRAVQARDADLVSSWVRFADLGPYTEGEHKFARFGDGVFAHGNLFLVRRRFPDARRARQRMDALYAARKSNLRFAWALGLPLFLAFVAARITGRLPSLLDTLAMAGSHFGIHFAAVVCPYPEIVLDIDEPEDYAAAERHLSNAECGMRKGECALAGAPD